MSVSSSQPHESGSKKERERCINACTHTHTHTRTQTHIHTHARKHTRTHSHTLTHTHTLTHIHKHRSSRTRYCTSFVHDMVCIPQQHRQLSTIQYTESPHRFKDRPTDETGTWVTNPSTRWCPSLPTVLRINRMKKQDMATGIGGHGCPSLVYKG